ncbi:PfkB family carbohydrate kinase [Natronomonas sp. EA1]|uniref:PfkB family carbohydrate kinase n=1 Tax=Natronomonas sp. EA1 TaxID=3421655 RepID=UPI003EBD61CE
MDGAVAESLDTLAGTTVCALPDGSVDRHVHVHDSETRLTDRETFGERIAAGERSFRFVEQWTGVGGQAVNVARQSHALGAETTLFGHVDPGLPFETVTLGDPAQVTVCEFEAGDVMLATESEDLRRCDAERLAEVGAFDRAPDVWVVTNFVSVPGVADVLAALPGSAPCVLDPGPITGIGSDRAARLASVVSDRTVISANRGELSALADALDTSVASLRETLGVRAVVVHETDEAVAFHGERTAVENFDAREISERTGAGDCFSAGLALALGTGWELERALALGNRCASYHVERAGMGTPEELRSFR